MENFRVLQPFPSLGALAPATLTRHFCRLFMLHDLFVSHLIVMVSQHQRNYSVTRQPLVYSGVINPDRHHVDASSLIDPVFRTSQMVRAPTVTCRLMNLISSIAPSARREDGFRESYQDLQQNTTTNTFWKLHPRTNLSQNSNRVTGC